MRAAAFDGYPSMGQLSVGGKAVGNAYGATHFSSGGVSFAHSVALRRMETPDIKAILSNAGFARTTSTSPCL